MAQNDKHTHGHGDSMTDPAQRAESVKRIKNQTPSPLYMTSHHIQFLLSGAKLPNGFKLISLILIYF